MPGDNRGWGRGLLLRLSVWLWRGLGLGGGRGHPVQLQPLMESKHEEKYFDKHLYSHQFSINKLKRRPCITMNKLFSTYLWLNFLLCFEHFSCNFRCPTWPQKSWHCQNALNPSQVMKIKYLTSALHQTDFSWNHLLGKLYKLRPCFRPIRDHGSC